MVTVVGCVVVGVVTVVGALVVVTPDPWGTGAPVLELSVVVSIVGSIVEVLTGPTGVPGRAIIDMLG